MRLTIFRPKSLTSKPSFSWSLTRIPSLGISQTFALGPWDLTTWPIGVYVHVFCSWYLVSHFEFCTLCSLNLVSHFERHPHSVLCVSHTLCLTYPVGYVGCHPAALQLLCTRTHGQFAQNHPDQTSDTLVRKLLRTGPWTNQTLPKVLSTLFTVQPVLGVWIHLRQIGAKLWGSGWVSNMSPTLRHGLLVDTPRTCHS